MLAWNTSISGLQAAGSSQRIISGSLFGQSGKSSEIPERKTKRSYFVALSDLSRRSSLYFHVLPPSCHTIGPLEEVPIRPPEVPLPGDVLGCVPYLRSAPIKIMHVNIGIF